MTLETPGTILDFWFGVHDSIAAMAAATSRLWWGKDAATDRLIRERFGPTLELAAGGELDAWGASTEGCLALILLTDQFPRNIHRGSAAAFAFDADARDRCRSGIGRGLDRKLGPLQRVFFYLPLEHSESIADQERSVMLFETLAREAPQQDRGLFDGYADFARRHREIVARFGRFPHRNVIVGRQSSREEESFLLQPGSSF
jgi:uncharacterized protein (DUF924 family)